MNGVLCLLSFTFWQLFFFFLQQLFLIFSLTDHFPVLFLIFFCSLLRHVFIVALVFLFRLFASFRVCCSFFSRLLFLTNLFFLDCLLFCSTLFPFILQFCLFFLTCFLQYSVILSFFFSFTFNRKPLSSFLEQKTCLAFFLLLLRFLLFRLKNRPHLELPFFLCCPLNFFGFLSHLHLDVNCLGWLWKPPFIALLEFHKVNLIGRCIVGVEQKIKNWRNMQKQVIHVRLESHLIIFQRSLFSALANDMHIILAFQLKKYDLAKLYIVVQIFLRYLKDIPMANDDWATVYRWCRLPDTLGLLIISFSNPQIIRVPTTLEYIAFQAHKLATRITSTWRYKTTIFSNIYHLS